MTDRQIEALAEEALAARDYATVTACERALNGDRAARALCEVIAANARAMAC